MMTGMAFEKGRFASVISMRNPCVGENPLYHWTKPECQNQLNVHFD